MDKKLVFAPVCDLYQVTKILIVFVNTYRLAGASITEDDHVAPDLLVPSMIFPNDDFETTTSTSVPTFFKNETKIESINDTHAVHTNNQKIYEESKNHQEDNIQAWITLSQVKLLFKVVKFCCVAEVSTFSIIITSLRLSFFRLKHGLTFNR